VEKTVPGAKTAIGRIALLAVGGAVGLAGALMAAAYFADVSAAERRVTGRSEVIQTRAGRLEYAVAGRGPPVLMIHGTGGGFDQGLLFTEGLQRHGYQVIAPSRFGYLRSDFPADPSSERQADSFVELLDKLHIAKAPVAGGSAGALSAVQFALRHPDRCSALILIVPAANVRGRDPVRMSALQEFFVRRLAASNFLFWAALKTRRDQLTATLLATDPALVRRASPSERRRAQRILEEIMPVAWRSRGMLNDARLAGRPARVDFAQLKAPTLVISVADDRFGTAATARDIAAATPGAKLVIYPQGGHIWIGHDAELWTAVTGFLGGAAADLEGSQF
jgi:pimeloyl-ACP methyl ester carboxylesterase